ncbi:hypothetical protein GGI25_004109 [Coemansia spiralis]|uniref:Pentacotripeptide-repeat region of PRORP domain-containing protein n=2 Tax=Coemansia TaxID=4863 RepID=A0A9W8G785_9FUNG|nr:hypothetical protein BX070DRAFT_228743 [Coemansia spiralis]KAJ1990630.1 hypothetical protein EDC05_003945 [Coemansia umbellata]KAJ2622393.1 hypothetical protein GGI26_003256 [Coemansia sp. RSA 1358]KAJ2675060.1 hypothetical protein GGI25_004109 [Coemansia spiralis]
MHKATVLTRHLAAVSTRNVARSTVSLAKAATLRRTSLPVVQHNSQQVRRYAAPLTDYHDEGQGGLTIPEQIQQIVNPSNSERIRLALDVTQSAYVQKKKDLGYELDNAVKARENETHDKLDGLYDKVRKKDVALTGADYEAFIDGYHFVQSVEGCLRALRDMNKHGFPPSISQYTMVLKLAANKHRVTTIYLIAQEMQLAGIEDTKENYAPFFSSLLLCLGKTGQIENSYAVYLEMIERGIVPGSEEIHYVITGLATIGEIDLALQILRESLGRSVAFNQKTYMHTLANAGFYMHHEAYKLCYDQLTTVFGAQITAGDCEAGLSIAARNGDSTLAADILQRLDTAGYPLQEFHFEALFDALLFCKKWDLAFKVLDNMRQAGYGKSSKSLRTLTRALTTTRDEAEELAEEVFTRLVNSQKTMPDVVDTNVLNAMVSGLASSKCVEAAASCVVSWFNRLGISRDADSYVGVLKACAESGNKTIAERMLTMLLDTDGLEPTKEVYELMIHTVLNQINYEDAFVYLDTMKAQDMVPEWSTYAHIVRRCAKVRDPRAQTALGEMRSLGYVVTPALESYASTYGRNPRYAEAVSEFERFGTAAGSEGSAKKDSKDSGRITLEDILGADAFKI